MDAAIEELELRGLADLTVEGIAARAGVGKQTIYRWWGSKAEAILEAMLDRAKTLIAVPDSGSLRSDLSSFLTSTFRQRQQRPALVALMGAAIADPEFAEQFKARFLLRRRDALREILERGVERGEIGTDVDLELVIDVVYGLLWYRLLVHDAALDDDVARDLSRFVAAAVGG